MMRLRIARILQGLHSGEVANATGVDRGGVNRFERGLLNPDTPRGRRVCSFLGLDPDWAFQPWRPKGS